MKQTKLEKLAKRLSSFNFEEIMVMSNENSNNVKTFLSEMISKKRIREIEVDTYVYNESNNRYKKKKFNDENGALKCTVFTKEEIRALEDERKTLDAYINAPKLTKNMVDKYLTMLKESNNATGRVLDNFIYNIWNKKNPDKKISKNSFLRAKRLFKDYGIAGMISPTRNFLTTNNQLDEEFYKNFREYLIANKSKNLRYNYINFRAKYLEEHPDITQYEYPSYHAFISRVRKDILKFKDSELAKIYDEKKKVKITKKKYGFKTFQAAAEDFLKDVLEKNEVGICVIRKNKCSINKFLVPYFKTTKLSELTKEKLEEYRVFLQEQQLSSQIITFQMNLIKRILKIYDYEDCTCSSVKQINSKFLNKTNILEKEDIKRLLNICRQEFSDFYPLILTVINTGLTRGEVLALTWDKLDIKNKKLTINKSIYNGKIISLRKKQARRTVDLPDKLIEVLLDFKKSKKAKDTDFIFPDENWDFQNPDNMTDQKFIPLIKKAGFENIKFIDLRDSYTVILIKQNLPLTYIQDQIGFLNIKALVDKFHEYIPEITKENFCIA